MGGTAVGGAAVGGTTVGGTAVGGADVGSGVSPALPPLGCCVGVGVGAYGCWSVQRWPARWRCWRGRQGDLRFRPASASALASWV